MRTATMNQQTAGKLEMMYLTETSDSQNLALELF